MGSSIYPVPLSGIQETLVDAKGDLIVGSAADATARLAVGTNDHVLTADSSTATGLKWAAAAFGATYAIFNDTKSSGTQGGTFTSGAFRTRDLQTTQINDITGCSLASNQITLTAGTYYVSAFVPAHACSTFIGRLQNITDGTTQILGQSAFTEVLSMNISTIEGKFTIAAQKVFEVQSRCTTTRSTEGFGVANSFGDNIYTIITITKIG